MYDIIKDKYILLILLTLFINPAISSAQWEKITTLPANVANVYWLDIWALPSNPNYLWVCGYNGSTAHSTDGGRTWRSSIIQNINQLETICFPSRTIGYTSGEGKIFKSIDGGISWFDITPANARVQIWGNYFITDDFGITLGGNCTGEQVFYRTSDGGRTWSEARYFEPNTKLSDVIMYEQNGLGYAVSSGFLWRTDNGGRDWQMISWTRGNDWHEDIAIVGSSLLIPVSLGCDGNQEASGGARFTTDLGASWTEFRTPKSNYGSFLFDERRGWVVGLNEQIYYTSDAGKTWALRNCGLEPGASLDDLWFLNDTTGFVVGDGIYRYSTKVIDKPYVLNLGPLDFCVGDSVVLSVSKNYSTIRWSNGATTPSITVKASGWYSYYGFNNRCDSGSSERVYVNAHPKPNASISISGKNPPCVGETATLQLNQDFPSVRWSNGATDRTILVTEPGVYSAEFVNEFGCSNTANFILNFNELPEPALSLSSDNNFCWGDSITIFTNSGFRQYIWFFEGNVIPSATSNRLRVGAPGRYYVEVTDLYGCVGLSDYVDIFVRNDTNQLELFFLPPSDAFDFGSVVYPEQKCKTAVIRNLSWKTAIIEDAFLSHNISFSVPMSQLPIKIEPSESAEITICYSPSAIKQERDTLSISDICSPHKLPLIAFGTGAEYSFGTNCDAVVNLNVVDISGKYNFSLGQSYPNPAAGIVNIPFYRYVPNDYKESSNETCQLFNSIGQLVSQGYETIINDISGSNGRHIAGLMNINTEGLAGGLYFAQIRSERSIEYLKIIIE